MHIYAFGSICRGDIDLHSDIDLLSIIDGYDSRFDPNTYSIYSYSRIAKIWEEGNPFAWHLATEAKLIYSSNGSDYIQELGSPHEYNNYKNDCTKFYNLFLNAFASIKSGSNSQIFELSTIFLSIRNFATCYLLGRNKIKDFSRHSAIHLDNRSLKISNAAYEILENSRIISTRGVGKIISQRESLLAIEELNNIKYWMEYLLNEVK